MARRKTRKPPQEVKRRFHVGHQTFSLDDYKLKGFTAGGKAVKISPVFKVSKTKRFKRLTSFKIPRNVKTLKIFSGRRVISTKVFKSGHRKRQQFFGGSRLKKIFYETGTTRTPAQAQDLVNYLETVLGISTLGDIQSGTLPLNRFYKDGVFLNDVSKAGGVSSKWRIYIAIEGERYSGADGSAEKDSIGWHIVNFSQSYPAPISAEVFRENVQPLIETFVDDTVGRHNSLIDLGRVQTEWRGGGYKILGVESE